MRKTCTKCKKDLSIKHFYKNNQRKDGLDTRCKFCVRAIESHTASGQKNWLDHQWRTLNLTGRDY